VARLHPSICRGSQARHVCLRVHKRVNANTHVQIQSYPNATHLHARRHTCTHVPHSCPCNNMPGPRIYGHLHWPSPAVRRRQVQGAPSTGAVPWGRRCSSCTPVHQGHQTPQCSNTAGEVAKAWWGGGVAMGGLGCPRRHARAHTSLVSGGVWVCASPHECRGYTVSWAGLWRE
jgi:hypothetical protein